MKTITELKQERAEILKRMHAMLDKTEAEKRALTEAESQEYDRLDLQQGRLAERIALDPESPVQRRYAPDRAHLTAIEEELRRVPAPLGGRPDPGEPWRAPGARAAEPGPIYFRTVDGRTIRGLRPAESLRSLLPDRIGDVPVAELSAGRLIRAMITGDWRHAEAERRAMGTAGGSGGQFLLPQPLSAQVIDLARARSVAVMLGATTIPMESKELDIAVVTGDPTAYWTAEGAPITESDMTFGRRSLRAYPLAILTRASLELVQDAPNAEQVIENAIAGALGVELDRALLYGTGALQPAGLRLWSGLNEISMGTNGAAITDFAKFVEAVQKVLEGNGPDPAELGVAMSPREFATVEKFEDTTGQPLQPPESYKAMRRRVSMQIKTDEIQGSASNAATLFVGDWRELLLGLRNEITVEASATAGTAFEQRQVLIRGTARADSVVGRDKWLTRVIGIIP